MTISKQDVFDGIQDITSLNSLDKQHHISFTRIQHSTISQFLYKTCGTPCKVQTETDLFRVIGLLWVVGTQNILHLSTCYTCVSLLPSRKVSFYPVVCDLIRFHTDITVNNESLLSHHSVNINFIPTHYNINGHLFD